MRVGTKFKAVHKMQATKFIVEKITEKDLFPYLIRGYQLKENDTWVPCDFTEEVCHRWFWKRKITPINDE